MSGEVRGESKGASRGASGGASARDGSRRPAWIETIPPREAEGLLEEVYSGIVGRSGSVANILGCQSLHPEAMREHYQLYRTIMFSRGVLSRADREAIAVAVSAANGCHY